VKKSARQNAEWTRYRVGVPSASSNWTNSDCEPFDTVYHICHLGDAVRVFEDGRIRSSLVWDVSKLRNSRTCVSWVSPNLWVHGSIYGNIRFDFDWRDLIEGQRFYWVESITHYNPPAYRILISQHEHSELGLKAYDPTRKDGPLFHDPSTDTWYRNGNYTGEFLVDADLSLNECEKVGFWDHHETRCKKVGSHCKYLGKRGHEAGAELIARLVGHNILEPQELFFDASTRRKRLHHEAAEAWEHLKRSLKVATNSKGVITHKHPAALYVVTAILDRFGLGRPKGTAKLCNLFSSSEELWSALTSRMICAFGLSSADGLQEN